MAHGKYLSLEEARKSEKMDQFAKEHPSKANGPQFHRLIGIRVDHNPARGRYGP